MYRARPNHFDAGNEASEALAASLGL